MECADSFVKTGYGDVVCVDDCGSFGREGEEG
jgi:hypothetical protein